jgi:hypothetical protein
VNSLSVATQQFLLSNTVYLSIELRVSTYTRSSSGSPIKHNGKSLYGDKIVIFREVLSEYILYILSACLRKSSRNSKRLIIQLYSMFLNIFIAQPEGGLIPVETLETLSSTDNTSLQINTFFLR